MFNDSVLQQKIESLRRELNEQYKLHSMITPELLKLSVELDKLLNQLHYSSFECNDFKKDCKVCG